MNAYIIDSSIHYLLLIHPQMDYLSGKQLGFILILLAMDYLNIVVKLLQQQENSPFHEKKSAENISKMYEKAKTILAQFQQQSNRCKKYNQAKIHRKYEIIIHDLQEQNANLKQKVKLQVEARPDSQIYVSKLITKLIEMKEKHGKLQQENEKMTELVRNLQQKYQPHMLGHHLKRVDAGENNQNIKNGWEKIIIKEAMDKFLKVQNYSRLITSKKQKSNFKDYLQSHKNKVERGTLINLFQRIEKWSHNMQDTTQLNKEKIKNGLQRSLQEHQDMSAMGSFQIEKYIVQAFQEAMHKIRKNDQTSQNPERNLQNPRKSYRISRTHNSLKKMDHELIFNI